MPLTATTKKHIFSAFVESTITYGADDKKKGQINATEMMF